MSLGRLICQKEKLHGKTPFKFLSPAFYCLLSWFNWCHKIVSCSLVQLMSQNCFSFSEKPPDSSRAEIHSTQNSPIRWRRTPVSLHLQRWQNKAAFNSVTCSCTFPGNNELLQAIRSSLGNAVNNFLILEHNSFFRRQDACRLELYLRLVKGKDKWWKNGLHADQITVQVILAGMLTGIQGDIQCKALAALSTVK